MKETQSILEMKNKENKGRIKFNFLRPWVVFFSEYVQCNFARACFFKGKLLLMVLALLEEPSSEKCGLSMHSWSYE